MGYLHVVIVDNRRKVIQTGAVGALDDMILFARPIDADLAANYIVQHELAFARHQQPHHAPPALGLETPRVSVGLRQPFSAVNKWATGCLCRVALRLQLLWFRKVAICRADFEQLCNRGLIFFQSLRLIVRAEWTADLWSFVPLEADPFQAVQDRRERF